MRILAIILFVLWALLPAHGDEWIPFDTKTGKAKVTSSNTGTAGKPIDFSAVTVTGLTVAATVNITATAPIIVTPSPLLSAGTISLNATSKANWDTAYTDRMKWDGGAGAWLNPATARTTLGLGTAALADAASFEPNLSFDMSIVQSVEGAVVRLAGDAATPGNSRYYGTDAGGTKGFFALPAGNPGTVTNFSAGDLSPLFTTTEATTTTTPALSFALSTAAANTVFGNATGSTAAPTFSSSPRFTAIGNLTGNGFVKTSGGTGTLSVDTTTYGTGSVTNFSAGDLSPLFTTTEATTTTTPALSFALSMAAANSWFGNATGSTAAPAFNTSTFPAALLPAYTGDVTKPSGSTVTTYNNAVPTGKGGLPTGGTTGQALTKIDATNYNTQWTTLGGGTGTVTSITATAPIVVTPTPLTSTGVISLTATTVGLNFLDLVNPSAIRFPKITAGNDVVAEDAATFRTSIGAQVAGSYEPALGNPSTSGYVLSSTTGGVRSWIAPASGGGTPGGSITQVQFHDTGGVFGGDAGLTYNKTTDELSIAGKVIGPGLWTAPTYTFSADTTSGIGNSGGAGNVIVYTNGARYTMWSAANLQHASGLVQSWTNADASGTPDIALSRNAAGIIEINNGTVGQYRDLKLRTLLASDGSYPGTPSISFAGWPSNGLLPWPGLGWPIMVGGGSPLMAWLTTDTRLATQITWGGGGVTAASDVGIERSAAGVLKVNNGSTGTGTITGKGTVLPGGATDQVLTKNSNADHDLKWTTPGAGGGAPNDGAFGVDWNGMTSVPPSSNAVYDWGHTFDTDDDGKVNKLDMGPGIVQTDVNGVVSAITGLDGQLLVGQTGSSAFVPMALSGSGITASLSNLGVLSISDFAASGGSHARGIVPDPGATGGTTKFLREDATWAVPAGGGGGTPGGSDTQVQFNDGGAFGGDANLTFVKGSGILTVPWGITAGTSGGGSTFGPSGTVGITNSGGNGIHISNNWGVLFSSTTAYNGTVDTAINRNAAGVVEINNGTAGQYRDLMVRNLTISGTCTGCGGGGGPSAWDTSLGLGGTGTASQGRIALGATTLGANIFQVANPAADSWMKVNALGAVVTENAATTKTSLGLTIGTNVQAWDTDLDTWATKTAPSGTVVGTTDTQTLSAKRITPRVTTITSSATPTVNSDNTDLVDITALAANVTSMTSGLSGTPTNGDKLIYRIKDNGTARTLAWGASFASSQSALPTTTVASKVTTVGFLRDTTKGTWECIAVDTEDNAMAALQTTAQNPTGTGGTALMGLGAAGATIIPKISGKLVITISGALTNTSTGTTVANIYYGTGTAPANGAAVTGTASPASTIRGSLGANIQAPFSLTTIVTGLTVGTTYWIDLMIQQGVAGVSACGLVTVAAYEIP